MPENHKTRYEELRDTRLLRVTTLYVVAGWLLVQFLDIALEAFGAPEQVMQWVLIAVLVGLPVTLMVEWLLRRSTYTLFQTAIALTFVVLSLAASALVYFNYSFETLTDESPSAVEAGQPGRRDGNPVLAVLPFNNMSPDADNEYLADGMTEDIITLLAQSPGLEVIARNSTFQYKGTSPDIRDVGKALGADYVIEGSIRPLGKRIRVTVQVIETRSGAHVWAQQYDRELAGFFDIQDEISHGIAAAAGDAVSRTEYRALNQSRPDDLGAWALTLRAMEEWNRLHSPEVSVPLLREAIELEPDYALAHAVLARQLGATGLYGFSEESLAEGVLEARKALALAPNDPRVLAYSALSLLFSGQSDEAVPLARKAVEISPSYAEGLAYYGDALTHHGEPAEGIVYLEKAIRLTPLAPEAALYHLMMGEAELHLGRFEAALASFRESNRLSANRLALVYQAGAEVMLDLREEAMKSLQRAREIDNSSIAAGVQQQAEIWNGYTVDDGGENYRQLWSRLLELEQSMDLQQQ